MYSLIISPRAEKHFAKLPKKLQQKIFINLTELKKDPFQMLDIKKLIGTKRSYRLRVGELRVLYEMDSKNKTIFVADIDFRRTTTY